MPTSTPTVIHRRVTTIIVVKKSTSCQGTAMQMARMSRRFSARIASRSIASMRSRTGSQKPNGFVSR